MVGVAVHHSWATPTMLSMPWLVVAPCHWIQTQTQIQIQIQTQIHCAACC